jgi:DNA-binding GntR family transcriptional regulator
VRAASITETVSADITTMSESVSLSCDRHTPLLVVTRTAKRQGQADRPSGHAPDRDGLSYG